jgi:oligoribonuclease (3'-5' exoribonuclease)
MADLMTRNKYKDACRYRMRETLENLLKIWDPDQDEDVATINNIDEAIDILQNTIDELKYFKEKIITTEETKV